MRSTDNGLGVVVDTLYENGMDHTLYVDYVHLQSRSPPVMAITVITIERRCDLKK